MLFILIKIEITSLKQLDKTLKIKMKKISGIYLCNKDQIAAIL